MRSDGHWWSSELRSLARFFNRIKGNAGWKLSLIDVIIEQLTLQSIIG